MSEKVCLFLRDGECDCSVCHATNMIGSVSEGKHHWPERAWKSWVQSGRWMKKYALAEQSMPEYLELP